MSQRSLSGAAVEYNDPRFSNEPVFHATASPPRTSEGPSVGTRVISHPERRPPPDGVKVAASPRNIFLGVGVALIVLLCILPVWNAAMLLEDSTYVFWHGKAVPASLIVVCVAVLVLYVVTIWAFFTFSMPQAQTEQTIMMTANIFLTLLGLAFMLVSIPLSKQATETYSNLIRKCDYSPETHRLFEYSQVLQNIRSTPECSVKFSVEECTGYEDGPPYTNFLKVMESDLKCSGFCYLAGIPGENPSHDVADVAAPMTERERRIATAGEKAASATDQAAADAVANAKATEEVASNMTDAAAESIVDAAADAHGQLLSLRQSRADPRARRSHSDAAAALAVLAAASDASADARAASDRELDARVYRSLASSSSSSAASAAGQQQQQQQLLGSSAGSSAKAKQGRRQHPHKLHQGSQYPPTLFSFSNFQASCEGNAARHMKNVVGGVASQTFYQGIYLVLIAVVTGFLKLFGFCVRRDHQSYKPPQHLI